MSLLVVLGGFLASQILSENSIRVLAAKPAKHAATGLQSKGPPPTFKNHFSKLTRQELADYLKNDITFAKQSDTSGYRHCGDGQESNRCLLEITAVIGSEAVSTGDPGKNGRVVAKIRNIGTLEETTLNIDSGETVLWVVTEHWKHLPFGPNESVLIDSVDGVRRNPRDLKFRSCDKPHPQPAKKWASFQPCPEDEPNGPHTLNMHLTPPWFPCEDGCCSSGGLTDA
jgi:hypothetical protein